LEVIGVVELLVAGGNGVGKTFNRFNRDEFGGWFGCCFLDFLETDANIFSAGQGRKLVSFFNSKILINISTEDKRNILINIPTELKRQIHINSSIEF